MADLQRSSQGSGEIKPTISWSSGNKEVEWRGMVLEEIPIIKKPSFVGESKPPIPWSNANIQLEWIGKGSQRILIEKMETPITNQDGLGRPEPLNSKEEMQPQRLEPPLPSEVTQPQRPNQDGLGEHKSPIPHKEKHKNLDEENQNQEIHVQPSKDEQAESSFATSNFSLYAYSEIVIATDNLSESSKVGRGGYGSVYKAKLRGTVAAVKMLDMSGGQGPKEFFQELDVLCQLRHPNLVNLVGSCFERRALVYEFLPRGSIEDCLNKSPNLLTWKIRTHVVYDICSALKFLHSRSVVHGDIKPDNILLDDNFRGKLADFGLCRFLPRGTTSGAFLETRPKGTFAYIDLKFLETGILRPSSDLYSFGVTILKLLTGLPPLGLSRQVMDANEKLFREMIDPTAGNWPFDVAKELAYWGLQCCYENEKSSQLMNNMWIGLDEMLDELKS